MTDKVTILGHCNSQQVRALYSQSAIVAVPSRSEGFSRVLIEAQSMSVPVVTYNAGGTSQALLPDKIGYLCRLGKIDELKLALEILSRDSYKRKIMGKAGRRFVLQHYTLEHLAQRHESYYRNILTSCGQNPEYDTVNQM